VSFYIIFRKITPSDIKNYKNRKQKQTKVETLNRFDCFISNL